MLKTFVSGMQKKINYKILNEVQVARTMIFYGILNIKFDFGNEFLKWNNHFFKLGHANYRCHNFANSC